MRYLIDSLDVGACLAVLVVSHLLLLALVVLRTYSAALAHQTPLRSGPVTMVSNGVSETQWRDGWGRQLKMWCGVFSVGPAVGYVALVWLAVSRWVPQHGWIVPVCVVVTLLLAAGGVGWWAWRSADRHEAETEPTVPVEVPPVVSQPYAEPYGTWRDGEGL